MHRYANGHEALKGVDLEVDQGDFIAIIGQNGSGKTTLAKHFNGLLRATAGSVEVAGSVVVKQSTIELSRTIGYCYQNPDHQIFASTVREEISFGPTQLALPAAEVEERTDRILDLVGLTDQQGEYPFNLGRGQRQILAVASVLAMQPRVLIVDEPTTGLDWRGSESLMGLINALSRQGTTVIVISHDMNLVARHAHRLVVMAGGEKIGEGPPRDVFAQDDVLRRAFLRAPQAFRISHALPEVFPRGALSAGEAVDMLTQAHDGTAA